MQDSLPHHASQLQWSVNPFLRPVKNLIPAGKNLMDAKGAVA